MTSATVAGVGGGCPDSRAGVSVMVCSPGDPVTVLEGVAGAVWHLLPRWAARRLHLPVAARHEPATAASASASFAHLVDHLVEVIPVLALNRHAGQARRHRDLDAVGIDAYDSCPRFCPPAPEERLPVDQPLPDDVRAARPFLYPARAGQPLTGAS